ncbi:hypothetical protein MNEG_8369 [Monoraphidium neglectum]|uniref:Uncharacterized protein n=1 Tax=Monoraphidium neglectum TaxID=145388 RepID=A0A0D2MFY9_9CHLO|nr:hypothetical protein MNEG_8369 [Monoraphidium neglectum]KIY99596.1 hypothetical protein MNEG_8369 [Monoraphidium neglectum]|eukprot:XP_013898616.1 hypothetical protein MNEG_8369 [Monoraphidium neglectum]
MGGLLGLPGGASPVLSMALKPEEGAAAGATGCATPNFGLGLHSPLFIPGLNSPGGGLGCAPSPGSLGCALGSGKWHADIDPEVWFDNEGEQLGSMQEFFAGTENASIFRADAGAAAPAGGEQRGSQEAAGVAAW